MVRRELLEFPEASRRALAAAELALAEHICKLVNLGLQGRRKPTRAFAADARALLLKSWQLAALLRSGQVLPMHLLASVVSSRRDDGKELAKIADCEEGWLLSGALIRLSLNEAVSESQPAQAIGPADSLLAWIAEAGTLAERRQADEAKPELIAGSDFVDVLRSRTAAPRVRVEIRKRLKEAADLGREPGEYVRTRREVENTQRTMRQRFANVGSRMGVIDDRVKAVAGTLKALSDGAALQGVIAGVERAVRDNGTAHACQIEEIGRETATRLDRVAGQLGAIEAGLRGRVMEPVPPLVPNLAPVLSAVGDVHNVVASHAGQLQGIAASSEALSSAMKDRLDRIGATTDAIDAKLSRSPSWAVLTLAVLTVLLLGAGAGWLVGR